MRYILVTVLVTTSLLIFGCGDDATSPDDGGGLSVAGYVRDGYGDAIVGAVVQIGPKGITTDGYGYYEIVGLPAGSYGVRVHNSGYYDTIVDEFLLQSLNRNADFRLTKDWNISIPIYDATVKSLYISGNYLYRDSNYGSSAELEHKYLYDGSVTEHEYAYIGFELASVPADAEIYTAVFQITKINTNAVDVGLIQVLGPWDEYGITFNNRPASEETELLPDSISISSGVQTVAIDFTQYVRAILQGAQFGYGIRIAGDDSRFYSRESQAGAGPRLIVTCKF